MKYLFFFFFTVCAGVSSAAQDTSFNAADARGRRHGQWIIRYPAGMGEEAFAEWGTYDHGVKWGAWYRFDGNAEVTSMEHFRAGVRDGEAKYFERGRLIGTGSFRGLNPAHEWDTIWVYDPSKDMEVRRIIASDRGSVKQGLWRYYDPETGRVTREIDYVLDEIVARKEFTVAATDSAWYKRAQKIFEYEKAHPYKPPRDKQFRYTDFK